ncbi:MAG TPA: dipeptidase [Candidatus Limnocylindria bacterium]|nr:dipeptidase [Candidatus Limnocylindria bacterium]
MATQAAPRPVTGQESDARARAHQSKTLIIDALSGHIVAPEPPPVDGKSYLERLRESGVNVVNITLAAHSDSFEQTLKMMYHYFNLVSATPDLTMQIETVDDIRAAHREGKIGIIFGSQTGTMVARDISRWTILHKLGLRVCQVTYNERNELGDGCMEPENRGLTSYGRQAVQEMNRLGIVVDLSHVGERTALDVTEYSTKPVIYSHSNAKALTPSRRNLTDEQMRAMAATGGVMGISSFSMMTYRELGARPTLEDYLNHIDYAVGLIGVDHVGIGSDIFESYTKLSWTSSTKRMYPMPYEYETKVAEGFMYVSELPNVIQGLVTRGYSDADIEKILGGNWLRVFSQVWLN